MFDFDYIDLKITPIIPLRISYKVYSRVRFYRCFKTQR